MSFAPPSVRVGFIGLGNVGGKLACGVDVLAPGFAAAMVSDEAEAPGGEVVANR